MGGHGDIRPLIGVSLFARQHYCRRHPARHYQVTRGDTEVALAIHCFPGGLCRDKFHLVSLDNPQSLSAGNMFRTTLTISQGQDLYTVQRQMALHALYIDI